MKKMETTLFTQKKRLGRGQAPHDFTFASQGQAHCWWAELWVPRLANTGRVMPFTFSIPPKRQIEGAGLDFVSETKSFWHQLEKNSCIRGATRHKEIPKLCRPEISVSKPGRWSVMGGHAFFIVTSAQGCGHASLWFVFNWMHPSTDYLVKFLILETKPP